MSARPISQVSSRRDSRATRRDSHTRRPSRPVFIQADLIHPSTYEDELHAVAAAAVAQEEERTEISSELECEGEEPPCPLTLTKSAIERLGRERPASLNSTTTEVFYIFSIVASMMISEYFISGFNIVMPPLAESLNIPNAQKTWPAAVPNLTTAAFLLPFSRLCDRFGGRAVFVFGLVWIMIWSLIGGFSQNTIMLIMCRAFQGIGNSAFLPAGLSLLGHTYRPGPRKNLVYGVYGAFAVLGFYVGLIAGAIAAHWLTWRWYFWIGAILAVIVLICGLITIPTNLGDKDPFVKMDWLGLFTIVPGLVCVVFAFTDGGSAPQGWKTPYIYVTLIIGILFLIGAIYVEGWVAKAPLLPAAIFKPKYMKRLLAGLFCWYGVFSVFLFYATYQ